MEKAKAFFGPEGLGLGIWYDVTLSSPGIEKMAHLPPGTLVQLAFLAGSKTARVEIINTSNLPDRLNITAKQRVGLSLGHSGWSFITHDIETACKKITLQGGKVISNMIQTDDPVHGKARIVSALTPEGSFIELWESN
jgi:predicted enzyme related to lactoylglutathione lyase